MNSKPDDISDDYVADILSREAKDKNIRYSALGLDTFLPKRPITNAPKPNTRFLRNIVREADSHNAALLAKEAEESKVRLHIMRSQERVKRRKEEASTNGESSRQKVAQRPDRELYRVRGRRLSSATAPTTRERDTGEGTRERKRRRSRSRTPEDRERSRSPRRERRRYRKRSRSLEYKRSESRSGKHRDYLSGRYIDEKEGGRGVEREKGKDKSSDKRGRFSDTRPRYRPPQSRRWDDSSSDQDKSSRKRKRTEGSSCDSPCTSSDPLDAIIGPAPPPSFPRARGRGTTSGSFAMDARFSEQYDPYMDMQIGPDDDWDKKIEAYRDRLKWKALGAERLRCEGFEEDYITAWENNDTKNTANIKWSKEGVREWDRGKVVEEGTGEVTIKACWGKRGG